LIPAIDPRQLYPYDFVCYRVTLFNTTVRGDAVIPGDELRNDLQALLLDLTQDLVRRGLDKASDAMTMDRAARRCEVSRSTVFRWRRHGLPTRYHLLDGRPRVGVRQSVLDAFLASNRERLERRSRPRRLEDGEREAILERARMLQRQGIRTAADAARRIAADGVWDSGVALRAIRRHNRRAKEDKLFPARSRTVTREERDRMAQASRDGRSVSALCREFNRSRAAVYRALRRARVDEVLAVSTKHVHNDEFDTPDAEDRILGTDGLAVQTPEPAGRKYKPPPGLPNYLRELYRIALLEESFSTVCNEETDT
jgi:hypothetical protein